MRGRGLLPLVAAAAAAVGFIAGREIWPREPRLVGRVIRVQSPALLPEPPERGPGSGETPAGAPPGATRDGGVPPAKPPDDGRRVHLDPDGVVFSPRMKIDLQGDEPVLLPDGPWSERYGNGRLKGEGEYADGKPVGTWRNYHENGTLAREAHYDHGDLQGDEILWHPNGAVRMRGTWRDGAKEGSFRYWDEDGNVVREEDWSGGALSSPIRLWDPKGEFPPEAEALVKASVNGKYKSLLRKVADPDARDGYGDFRDYGMWTGAQYMGHADLPQGYWVFVYPYWYIWADKVAE